MNRVQALLEKEKANIEKRKEFLVCLKPPARIHISGICGTATASLAYLLKDLGYYITGSDKAFYPPMDKVVGEVADELFIEYAEENFSSRPDLVIIGNSISRDNPEAQFIEANDIPFASLPEALEQFLIGDRKQTGTSVVFCGTHGKTTTTALMSSLLESAKREPGYFVGGVVEGLEKQIKLPASNLEASKKIVVLEGDEYDSAYFAKWSKFHSYRPDILVVTGIEFDHADIYETIEDIKDEFTALVSNLPSTARIFLADSSKELVGLAAEWKKEQVFSGEIFFYGENANSSHRLLEREASSSGQKLKLSLPSGELELNTNLSGKHNAENILVVTSVAKLLGLSNDEIAKGIADFSGVKRRQQKIFDSEKAIVLEDFAHHPTAVRLTLDGIRERYPDNKITVVFEPRSNTSRRAVFQKDYAESFDSASRVFIRKTSELLGYQKHSYKQELLDIKKLVDDISSRKVEAREFSSVETIIELLEKELLQNSSPVPEIIVLVSNGDFDGLPVKLIDKLTN